MNSSHSVILRSSTAATVTAGGAGGGGAVMARLHPTLSKAAPKAKPARERSLVRFMSCSIVLRDSSHAIVCARSVARHGLALQWSRLPDHASPPGPANDDRRDLRGASARRRRTSDNSCRERGKRPRDEERAAHACGEARTAEGPMVLSRSAVPRQADRERRAVIAVRVDGDRAAMRAHDLAHDVESQPEPARARVRGSRGRAVCRSTAAPCVNG